MADRHTLEWVRGRLQSRIDANPETDTETSAYRDAIVDVLAEVDGALKPASSIPTPAPPPATVQEKFRVCERFGRWVVETEMLCINGFSAWVTVADTGLPDPSDQMCGFDHEGWARRICAALNARAAPATAAESVTHIVRVQKTPAGPILWLGDVAVREWLAPDNQQNAEELAELVRAALTAAGQATPDASNVD